MASDSTEIVLEEITIHSDLFEVEKKDFGGSVSILKPQTINKANGLYLQPVLNSVPGVYMQSGALNTNRITIRGIGSRTPFGTDKIKAYLDEIPLSTGEGETTIEDIDFATLGGIEVYRGPVSTAYGAGLGGAIHMITKRPDGQSYLKGEASFGSFGLRKFNLSGQVGSKAKSLSLFFQDVSSDGYRDNNRYDRRSLTAIGKVSLGSKSDISTYLNLTHLKAQIPSSINEDAYTNSPTDAESRWGAAQGFEDNNRFRLGVSLNTSHNESTESTVTAFMNMGQSDEVRPTFLGNTDSDFMNFGFRSKIKKGFLSQNRLNLILGIEAFFEGLTYREFDNVNGQNGTKNLDFDNTRNYGNVFLASEFRPTPDWIISLGGNLNFSKYGNTDVQPTATTNYTADHSFGNVFSPKLSVRRKFGENISLYGLMAHGFSLPSFEQTLHPQEGDDRLNRDISAETAYNYEAGLKGNILKDKLYFETSFYRMNINDLLVSQTLETGTFSVNAGKAFYKGVELTLDHKIVQNQQLALNHRFSYSRMNYNFGTFIHAGNDHSGNTVTGVPDYVLDYALYGRLNFGLYWTINWQGAGSMYMRDDNTASSESYNLLNLKLGYQQDIGKFTLDLYAGINNTLDEKYASMIQPNAFGGRYYYPGLPRNYFSGMSLSYRF